MSQNQIGDALITPAEAVLVSGIDITKIGAPHVVCCMGGNGIGTKLTAARVVGAPIGGTAGQRLTYIFKQSGAAGFAITWNAIFGKPLTWADTNNTYTAIAHLATSAVSFVFDGTNWVQDGAQVPYKS